MSVGPNLYGFSKDEIRDALQGVRHPVSVAIYGSKNEFNIGGMIRACHNFLVKNIHLVEVEWFYEKGALSTLSYEKKNIIRWKTCEDFIAGCGQQNIVAFERRVGLESEDIRFFDYPKNPILFFGSEQTGVPDSILSGAKSVVSIPIDGLNNDHNVTVSCGIALYDWYLKDSRASLFSGRNTPR